MKQASVTISKKAKHRVNRRYERCEYAFVPLLRGRECLDSRKIGVYDGEEKSDAVNELASSESSE